MLLPSIFNDNFIDNVFDDMFSFPTAFSSTSRRWMSTNLKELGEEYQLEIELPGYDKKDIRAELRNGYLTVSAGREETRDENDKKSRYVRRERYCGSCQRSFYVGESLKEEDFKASFENGVLKLVFPKENNKAKLEEKKYIAIE